MVVAVENIPFVDLSRQYAAIGSLVEASVLSVLRSGHYVGGPEVKGLEAEFANYCGTEFAVAMNSGTAALHAALLALGIGPGDEVITVSHTFFATAEAIVAAGAIPVFVDIEPGSMLMDPRLLEAALTSRTRAIIPVHLYGRIADMKSIMSFASAHGLAVIEDACQAHGAVLDGRRAGSMGDVGCFSFYPSKNLGAAGEGGMAVANSPDVAQRLRMLRDHGQTERYHHDIVGFNYRLPDIQAAALRVKLPMLDQWNARRRVAAKQYEALLDGADVILPESTGPDSVFHLYVIRSAKRDYLAAALAETGIATGLHYPVPIHRQPAFRQFSAGKDSLPVTEAAADQVLSLPMFPELTADEVRRVAEELTRIQPKRGSKS